MSEPWPKSIPMPDYYCPACRISRIPPTMRICSRCKDKMLREAKAGQTEKRMEPLDERAFNAYVCTMEKKGALMATQIFYADDKPAALWRRIQHRLERAGEAVIRLVTWLAVLAGFACFTIGISVVSAMLIGVKWITAIALLKSLAH